MVAVLPANVLAGLCKEECVLMRINEAITQGWVIVSQGDCLKSWSVLIGPNTPASVFSRGFVWHAVVVERTQFPAKHKLIKPAVLNFLLGNINHDLNFSKQERIKRSKVCGNKSRDSSIYLNRRRHGHSGIRFGSFFGFRFAAKGFGFVCCRCGVSLICSAWNNSRDTPVICALYSVSMAREYGQLRHQINR